MIAPKSKISDCLIVFLLICISGNPLFIYSTKWIFVLCAPVFILFCIDRKKPLFSRKLIFWLGCSIVLSGIQFLVLSDVSFAADINVLFKIFIAFAACSALGQRFRSAFFCVMTVICAISLICSGYYVITKDMFGFETDRYLSVVFFNFLPESIDNEGYRNAGLFWEPGAFQAHILLIPILYLNRLSILWHHKFESTLLLLALLSTKSTTGFLTLMFLVLAILLLSNKIDIWGKALLGLCALLAFCVIVWNFDFIGEKILDEVEVSAITDVDNPNWSRTGAFLIDIHNIRRHPFIGNGHLLESRYLGMGELMKGTGNGFTGAINMYGIIFVALFFYSLLSNFKSVGRWYKLVLAICVIMLLFGEYLLNYPLFWCLLFVAIPSRDKNNTNSTCNINKSEPCRE